MQEGIVNWGRKKYSISLGTEFDLAQVAELVYDKACRYSFDSPGFCVVNLGRNISSSEFRQIMVDLKEEMANIHEEKSKNTLVYLSAARFDQQTTTKPHLDAGPEECFLMLGYEPSEVDSELVLFDYTCCANSMKMTPDDFMGKYNPMFKAGYNILKPYSTRVATFSKEDYQIVCINNSSALPTSDKWKGVLHTATILTPDDSKRRVINSTMISSAPKGTQSKVSDQEIQEFVSTSIVRRKGYANTHLEDGS